MAHATIVLLEDHVDSLEMYGLLLRHAGYDVRETSTADAALTLLRELRPDGLVMGIGLRDIDGIEFCRCLRHDPRLESLPIIGMTGWVNADAGARLTDAPFTELLQTPVQPDVLLSTVLRWVPTDGVVLA